MVGLKKSDTDKKRIIAHSNSCGERLDLFLTKIPEIHSRSFAEKLISEGLVEVEGARKPKSYKLKQGEKVVVTIPPPIEFKITPFEIEIDIKYEDNDVIVISKPSGLVTHPSPGHWNDTLVNALYSKAKSLSQIGGVVRAGIVHRLDKDTSGLMVVAKNNNAHLSLTHQLKERKVKRHYLALTCGAILRSKFEVRAPIKRHRKYFQKMAIDLEKGKEAITCFKVKKLYQRFTLVEASLLTGRTHQIRVHLSSIGHPVAGDPLYGGIRCARGLSLERLFLHAVYLEFRHPRTGETMMFKEELPVELQKVLNVLDKQEQKT